MIASRKPPKPIYSFQQDLSVRIQELGSRARIVVEVGLRRMGGVFRSDQGVYSVVLSDDVLEFLAMPWVEFLDASWDGGEVFVDFEIHPRHPCQEELEVE